MKEDLNNLSNRIIGAAIEVHRELGPGLLESSYEAALHYELQLQGVDCLRQISLPIVYKDLKVADSYRIDLLVGDSVIVELKTVPELLPIHSAQLLTYLRMSGKCLGLLVNFHSVRLVKGIRRLVHNLPE
jgi:GxxExxY protein